jgi:hypothetical protein
MKKIALLLIIVCAGNLYGMEQAEKGHYTGIAELSPEIQVMIIQALNTYDNNLSTEENITRIVNAIKAINATNKQLHGVVTDIYGDLKGLTALIGTLAEKFPSTSRKDIAKQLIANKFNTELAQEYLSLADRLFQFIVFSYPEQVTQLIKEGADVNYSDSYSSLLFYALKDVEMVKLLLDFGANPYLQHPNWGTVFDVVKGYIKQAIHKNDEVWLKKLNVIKALLEDTKKIRK